MTRPAAERALPRPFVALFVYTLRSACRPSGPLLLALPCVGALLFGLLARTVDDPTPAGRFNTISGALFGLVLPLACLVVGDAVLGAEVRAGTFGLTWLSPVRFSTIVLARWSAGWLVAAAALAPAWRCRRPSPACPTRSARWRSRSIAGTAAYLALFVFIGAAVRRAAWWSLAIVLLGERLLGAVLTGIAQLSPQWLATMVYAGLGSGRRLARARGHAHREVPPSGASSCSPSCSSLLAVRRIRRLRLTGVGE